MAIPCDNSHVFGLPSDYGYSILEIDKYNKIALRNPWGFVSFRN